jgi:hypothetical protein
MSPTLVTTLTLISGISWTIVYIELIRRGFLDRTYGMPLFALAFNIAWEFMYAFLAFPGLSLQRIVNITWFLLDAVIVYTYFRYGRRDFPPAWQRYFIPWSLLAFAIGFVTIHAMHYEFENYRGAIYSAFAQNLMMSVLFIAMLVRRNNVQGQSMYIALFKWLGTLAPTIQFYGQTGSHLVLALGIGCFVYDLIYMGMLYLKFRELKLNPFTRQPVEGT